ncbi:hypothetical protein FRACYDRAFT_240704 [Fragilariopsis cylindrus CCMP1102]|uniref:Uncharacterized protein n=1 Tax=Fragilariopsis cylindrus CCMP1102 TaxID=635003 RepID=A0A1E7F8M2_9STRA|nr:hypothetical protein FRACYDRAFT_240704 [Fragilariopsis cylindrus CCMP1102]|eukprot:OEU14173.1 hypothetical protein FRACYDRAFT_240704 [Fragilariopsis cylindrus CCMP1102]
MTYQKPTPNYDNADADADESSSLFLTVADATPTSSLGQERVATKKNGVLMVAVVATCFLLGTIYSTNPTSVRNNDKNDSASAIAEFCGQVPVANAGACSIFIDTPNFGNTPADCIVACITSLNEIVNNTPEQCAADCINLFGISLKNRAFCNTACLN